MQTPPISLRSFTQMQDQGEAPSTVKTTASADKPDTEEKKEPASSFSFNPKQSRRNFELLQQRARHESLSSAETPAIGSPKQSLHPEAASVQPSHLRNAHALQRRNSIHSHAGWSASGQYDRLGERVSEGTFKNLAGVVEQRVNFRQGKGAVASVAQKFGLTRTLALPTHLVMVLQLAFTDPELLKIAKMGLRIAMANPETNGVPPEGFKPLYDLLEKWGYNRQGVLVDQEKFDARKRFMEERGTDIAAFKQFSSDIVAKLPPGSEDDFEYTAHADKSDDSSLLSLLVAYFTQFPQPKEAATEKSPQ